MVSQAAEDFIHLPPNSCSDLRLACWGHDLIEDARVSYNDCKKVLGEYIADIIYAVTNEKGRTRDERANDKYYHGIIETPGAIFVKLCDRIANVQYSSLTKSRMLNLYRDEYGYFEYKMRVNDTYEPMFEHLRKLLNIIPSKA
jgi:hypothetical protein